MIQPPFMQHRQRKWLRVTKANPCPICEHGDWCGRSDDGQAVICMRCDNGHPTRNGGFLYVWDGGAFKAPQRRSLPFGYNLPPPPPPRAGRAVFTALGAIPEPERLTAEQVAREIDADTDQCSFFDGLRELAGAFEDFGVDAYAGIGVFLSKTHRATLGFPLRDADGTPVGVRYRAESAKKWSLRGGTDGLFFDPKILLERPATVYVTEGATDTLALASLGLPVVGRSSCATGKSLIAGVMHTCRARSAVIVGDHEQVKQIRLKAYLPGMAGAEALAKSLKVPAKIIYPGTAKDIRAYILTLRAKGYSTAQIAQIVQNLTRDAYPVNV